MFAFKLLMLTKIFLSFFKYFKQQDFNHRATTDQAEKIFLASY